MLMTVLRGEIATLQSRALVIAFKAMKDYIVETQGLVTQRDLLRLSMQTTENTEAIRSIHCIPLRTLILAEKKKRVLL